MELIEIKLNASFHFDFFETVRRCQGKKARIGIDRFSFLPWTAMAIIAPSGKMLAAMGFPERVFDSAIRWQNAQDTEGTYLAFMKEFRSRGVKKPEIPSNWLTAYGSLECYGGKHAGLWKYKQAFDAQYARGLIVPSCIEIELIQLLQRIEESLGSIAYVLEPDGMTLDEWRLDQYQYQSYLEFVRRWPMNGMLKRIHRQRCASRNDWRVLMREANENLSDAIAALEQGRHLEVPIDPATLCVPDPAIHASAIDADEEDRRLEELSVSLRSRFVRLLKWPHMAGAIRAVLELHKMTLEKGLEKSLPSFPVSDRLPYDIAEELEGYFEDLEVKYPWVTENPFDDVTDNPRCY